MKGKLLQPVVFNVITILAMLVSLAQLVAVANVTSTDEVIAVLDGLIEEGAVEYETLPERLVYEQEQRALLAIYVLTAIMVAILANVIANYIGRGRHFENTARIRELKAELSGFREGELGPKTGRRARL